MSNPKRFLGDADDVADWSALARGTEVWLYRNGELHRNTPVRVTRADEYELWYGDPDDLDAKRVTAVKITADSDKEHPTDGWQVRRL